MRPPEPLVPGAPRYAGIDRVVEGEGPRGPSVVEPLARKIEYSDCAVTQSVTAGRSEQHRVSLLAGHSGA
jgi:hypothetical protein